jgi:hypothetical protein
MVELTHAPVGGSKAAEFGINGGWGGIRTTSALLINLMQIQQILVDILKMGKPEIKEIETDGYAIQKFRNVDVNWVQIKQEISDADFPISV